MIITIDGFTATGKSYVARLIARNLSIMHINSGLIFRALGYLLSQNYNYTATMLQQPLEQDVTECLDPHRLRYGYDTQTQRASVVYDGQDITNFLMTKESDLTASLAATNAYVQYSIIDYIRAVGQAGNCVIDGRNGGSIIFPHAHVKIFLTASLEIRAERWRKDRGDGFSHEQACAYINERDMRDKQRVVAPLMVPSDAHMIDTSFLTPDQVCQKILEYVKQADEQKK